MQYNKIEIIKNRLINRYKLLALNRYKWENLPDGIESRHIENFLYENGQALFYNDDDLGLVCFRCGNAGSLNVYGDPIKVVVQMFGASKHIDVDKGIRILNNDLSLPDSSIIFDYAHRIAEIEIVIQRNIKQQRFPYIISSTTDTKRSLDLLFKKLFESDDEAIFVDKVFQQGDGLGINVMKTDAPYMAEKLFKMKQDLEQELLTILGIDNNPESKKERMIVDEIHSNDNEIKQYLDLGYKSRKFAADLINEKFGLSINVSIVNELIKKEEEDEYDY
jgi:hypothetical protein